MNRTSAAHWTDVNSEPSRAEVDELVERVLNEPPSDQKFFKIGDTSSVAMTYETHFLTVESARERLETLRLDH